MFVKAFKFDVNPDNNSQIIGEKLIEPKPLFKVKSKCSEFACKSTVYKSGKCEDHLPKVNPSERPKYHDWYKTPLWSALKSNVLAKNVLCIKCEAAGITSLATVVDHAVPHRGNWSLFKDASNLRALCMSCHSLKTAHEKRCRINNQKPRSFYADTREP